MSNRDDEFDNDGESDNEGARERSDANGGSIEDSLTDAEREELGADHPLADLSPFADGFEGTNIDEDSDFELEDSEYASDAAIVYEELLARIHEPHRRKHFARLWTAHGAHDESALGARQRAHRDRWPRYLQPRSGRELGRHPSVLAHDRF